MRFLTTVFAALAIMASFGGCFVQAEDSHLITVCITCGNVALSNEKAEINLAIKKENTLANSFATFNVGGLLSAFALLGELAQFVALYGENPALVTSGPAFTFYGSTGLTAPTNPGNAGTVLSISPTFNYFISAAPSTSHNSNTPIPVTGDGSPVWVFDPVSQWPAPGPAVDNNPPYNFISVSLPTGDQFSRNLYVTYLTGNNPTTGDPQFNGMQGQSFQFHGMADEVFSLVSSPDLQMNSLFKFISSGTCNYNETVCWSHPGTYLGQIGLQYGADTKILLQAGSHADGMRVFVNDKEISTGKHLQRFHTHNATALMQFERKNVVEINTEVMFIRITNSDYFFNLDFGMKNTQTLAAGSVKLAVTGEICEREASLPKSQLSSTKATITKQLQSTYPAYPLHGLIGQTWRNAIYCGRYYEGTVDDYVTGGLFSNEHTFNYFKA